MNGATHRAISKEESKQTLTLVKLFFRALSLLLTSKDVNRHIWTTFSLIPYKLSYCQCQMADRDPHRAPKATAQQKLLSTPSPPTRNKLGAAETSSAARAEDKRNPPSSPPSTATLFFQAVTTCEAFPQAEHKDLINCRSMAMLSCPNSLTASGSTHCCSTFYYCLSSLSHIPALLPASF